MGGRGRGRGRGAGGLNLPGADIGADLPSMLHPPLTFPTLEFKPMPMNVTAETRYMLNVKKDFAENMQESPNYVSPIVIKKDIERYCDRYQDLLSTKQSYEKRYDWSRMPVELKPQTKKRKGGKVKTPAKKKQKDVDVESKLTELEKKENTTQSDGEENEKDEDEEKDPDDQVEGEEEEIDEEMDEGTDYVNNYFDNGENYEDDEENLDDGAIF